MQQSSRPAGPLLLGIDAGTAAVKAGIFAADGHQLSVGARSYPTHFPRPGWADQDPVDWWNALVGAVGDCVAGVAPADIAGISADATTCTLLPVAADGRPLRRALLRMDVRAADQAAAIFATDDEALRYSLTGVNAEWMPPQGALARSAGAAGIQADRSACSSTRTGSPTA